jgi:hypothetical protein
LSKASLTSEIVLVVVSGNTNETDKYPALPVLSVCGIERVKIF